VTTCIVTITDGPEGTLNMEGRIDGHEPGADLPAPTAALIVASYIAAHAQQISEAAAQWFMREVPKSDIEGAPV